MGSSVIEESKKEAQVFDTGTSFIEAFEKVFDQNDNVLETCTKEDRITLIRECQKMEPLKYFGNIYVGNLSIEDILQLVHEHKS